MPADDKLRVELGGVPETLLWTLWHRAAEARRASAVLPLAARIPALRRAWLTVFRMRFSAAPT